MKYKNFMLKEYVFRLILRIGILGVILWAYIAQPHYFDIIWTKANQLQMEVQGFDLSEVRRIWEEQYSVIWVYIVWAIFMLSMLFQMFSPKSRLTMGARKVFAVNYQPVENYSELELYKTMQKSTLGAYKVLLVWCFFNAIFGILYLFGFIQIKELVLLTAFYYVSDLICVVIWCPFQRYLMKNRCCVNCRIFNWGYFMIFTPFLFIRNFFTWSLFFMALILLLRWEITITMKPERFWDGSNDTLKCENCKDKICMIKGKKLYDEAGHYIKNRGK